LLRLRTRTRIGVEDDVEDGERKKEDVLILMEMEEGALGRGMGLSSPEGTPLFCL
jgi:hypothetical protein